ncbi:MAG: type II secretion system F family protein [Candidatus Omnitrophica bacterium]|nr:type II secretion system F family protein [Candidatus Omnitrophota bacterium]
MQFHYKAKKLSGEVIEGVLEADNRKLVVHKLQQMRVFPISIKEKGGGQGLSAEISLTSLRRVSKKDVTTFSRQMSDLLRAGLPLVRSLQVISQQTSNPRMVEIIRSLSSDVEGGMSFSDALAKHPKNFSSLYSSMTKAGETGGNLDQVMERLAAFLEAEQENRGKIISALTYPAFMIVVCVVVVIVLLTVVVPNFMVMFEESDIELPVTTQILLGFTHFLKMAWWAIIGGVGGGIFLLYNFIKSESGSLMFDKLKLQIPIIGEFIRKREISKFARTLGTLLANGVQILKSLSITESVISNQVLKKDIEQFQEDIKEGERLSTRMSESDLFPPVAVNMVSVGEETGNLETTLQRVADTFDKETDRLLKTMMTLIEPMMIVLMAVVVGFVVFAMIMPIFQISNSIGQ